MSSHFHTSIEPEIADQGLPNAEHTIRIHSTKKVRGNETDGAFLSSVTFQLEKIFEDKDDGKGDMYISVTLLLDLNRGHLITRNFIASTGNESPSIVLVLMLHGECDFSEQGLDLTLSVIVEL